MDPTVQYFMEQTNARLDKIDTNIEKLLRFKWQIIGGSVIFSVLCSAIITMVGLFLTAKGG